MPVTSPATTAPHANPIRSFGRYALRGLLGKSAATMVWLAYDPQQDEEVMLALPRVQPADAAALEHWLADVRRAARLDHPRLLRPSEVEVQDHWPYVAVPRRGVVTLPEWRASHGHPPPEQAAGWLCDVLQGLAFAHDAGLAHLDLQLPCILIDERGTAGVMALGVAGDLAYRRDEAGGGHERAMSVDTHQLRAQRDAAARDVLACGVLLHELLSGQPVLDQPDIAAVIGRMTPLGRELVRLPWNLPLPIPDALRAIANRCTASQERLRYQSARTLAGALQGWRESHADTRGGPVGLLLERLHTVGHLPALPGLAARVASITGTDSQRTDEMAEQALDDMALTFELLRTLNSAQVQGTQIAGEPSVLTLGRIISLIGVNGVRLAANTLRAWPGPLDAEDAKALQRAMERVRLAAHTAQALRPAGYDAQVVYLITVLQNLGRLMVRYHFADEAEQIQQLMQSIPARPELGLPEQPGLTEAAAAYAVLGVDIETLGETVARQWGLSDDVLHMSRPLPLDTPVRKPDSDADVLRIVASAANEAVDTVTRLPAARVGAALAQLAQRYARALGVNGRDLHDALLSARDASRARPPTAARTLPPRDVAPGAAGPGGTA
ncbi:MAG: HDOD domain-containing protein [Proteobacteria bacterium]|nr:HDOD domain-containing protein [Pseudomonadota bacterium]